MLCCHRFRLIECFNRCSLQKPRVSVLWNLVVVCKFFTKRGTYGLFSHKYWDNQIDSLFSLHLPVEHTGIYFTGNRCFLVLKHSGLSFDSRVCFMGTEHHLSVSEWDWVAMTSLGDFPVILMVICSICLSFRAFLGDIMEPTVISFPSFPQSCAVCRDKTC